MLIYDQPINQAKSSRVQAPRLGRLQRARPGAIAMAPQDRIASAALLCAGIAVAIGKSLNPKYTASVQLYVDPRELQLVDRELTPRAQDVSGLSMVAKASRA